VRRLLWIRFLVIPLFIGVLCGWGYEGHRRINRVAGTLVPGQFGEFILAYQDTLVNHAPDPDRWRKTDPEEGYRHYIDMDYYGSYPFDRVTHNLEELRREYGKKKVLEWGIAPWTIEGYCQRITERLKKQEWHEALLDMAVLGHYMADIHMPLHVVANYNGQLTGNTGIHFRWETQMVNRYVTRIDPVGTVKPVEDPLEAAFSVVEESYALHTRLLRADSLARRPLSPEQRKQLEDYKEHPFDSQYLAVLYSETQDVVEDRLGKAAVMIASLWYTCWLNAGSPKCPLP